VHALALRQARWRRHVQPRSTEWFPTLEAAARAKKAKESVNTTTNRQTRRISGRFLPKPLRSTGISPRRLRESPSLFTAAPVAKQLNLNACCKADTWTSAFYTGELKHA
jgi:hypothetical protein